MLSGLGSILKNGARARTGIFSLLFSFCTRRVLISLESEIDALCTWLGSKLLSLFLFAILLTQVNPSASFRTYLLKSRATFTRLSCLVNAKSCSQLVVHNVAVPLLSIPFAGCVWCYLSIIPHAIRLVVTEPKSRPSF